MTGGVFTTMLLTLVVIPAIYVIWRWQTEVKREGARDAGQEARGERRRSRMKKNNRTSWRWGTTIALLALNLVIGLWLLHGSSSAQEAKRFVYKVVDVPGDTQTLQATLNEYGSGGWELVAVAIGDIQMPRLIFKK